MYSSSKTNTGNKKFATHCLLLLALVMIPTQAMEPPRMVWRMVDGRHQKVPATGGTAAAAFRSSSGGSLSSENTSASRSSTPASRPSTPAHSRSSTPDIMCRQLDAVEFETPPAGHPLAGLHCMVVYRADTRTEDEIIAAGGFKPRYDNGKCQKEIYQLCEKNGMAGRKRSHKKSLDVGSWAQRIIYMDGSVDQPELRGAHYEQVAVCTGPSPKSANSYGAVGKDKTYRILIPDVFESPALDDEYKGSNVQAVSRDIKTRYICSHAELDGEQDKLVGVKVSPGEVTLVRSVPLEWIDFSYGKK